jgi:RHS repeat-associated protein
MVLKPGGCGQGTRFFTKPRPAKQTLPGITSPTASRRWRKVVGDQTFVVVTDHLGTPTAMYDGAGKLAWRMQLDLFGVPKVGSSGDGEECNWRWPGQYEDREIGLYYNRFRYYDPTLGQYISQDPIGLSGGLALST